MTQRTLWLIFTTTFTLSLIGAAVLYIPTLEFTAVDIIEKLHLPPGPIANIAIYAEFVLFPISLLGLTFLTIRHLLSKRRSKAA